MVIFNITLKNLYSFKDFSINFTYKKKIVNNPLGEECLKDFPNFRYRRVNIITGSNSSGKTTLGKAIMNILNFIHRKEAITIIEAISNKESPAYFMIDYYSNKGTLNRLECHIFSNASSLKDLDIHFYTIPLDKNDSYESAIAKINKNIPIRDLNLIDSSKIGWNFNFPFDTDEVRFSFPDKYSDEYVKVLNAIIKTLDSSISEVKKSNEMDKCYNVYFKNGIQPIPVEEGRRTHDLPRLSSGTKYAFNLAAIYLSVKYNIHGFYYIDEQFSYLDNDVENAYISLLCSMIRGDSQLMITSHNINILDLNLPHHAFGFLIKKGSVITYLNASTVEKKNNVSIKNDYENDLFNASTNISEIINLGN